LHLENDSTNQNDLSDQNDLENDDSEIEINSSDKIFFEGIVLNNDREKEQNDSLEWFKNDSKKWKSENQKSFFKKGEKIDYFHLPWYEKAIYIGDWEETFVK
jgi:hypothetical protein